MAHILQNLNIRVAVKALKNIKDIGFKTDTYQECNFVSCFTFKFLTNKMKRMR